MESTQKPKETAAMPTNPKPIDEVQLNIETVTPDTEKDVVPTKDITGGNAKDQRLEAENSKDLKENPAVDEASKDGEDPRDLVETVSP